MKNIFFYIICISFFSFSCSKKDEFNQEKESLEVKQPLLRLHQTQARVYAEIFTKYFDDKEISPELRKTLKTHKKKREVEGMDYLIENGDTLLYAINYKDGQGFVLITGSNGAFPILAHSNEGNLHFSEIDSENPLKILVENAKEKVRETFKYPNQDNLKYFEDWKDLGREGYEYEIELSNDEPTESKITNRRGHSTGKQSVYPHTGKNLDAWHQLGDYNFYAKNAERDAPIGCPAVAIGMLMYDTSNRIMGKNASTTPYFSFYDAVESNAKLVSKKLRQIADSIPNYQWAYDSKGVSGAFPADVLRGLHKLGFKKAKQVPYDLEVLYQNMRIKNSYAGAEFYNTRGVLMAGYENWYGRPVNGHIWFCDGYYEQTYTVTRKFLGIRVKRWTEYEDKLYMNWGWGPKGGNGWYYADGLEWTKDKEEGGTRRATNYQTMLFINLDYENNNNH